MPDSKLNIALFFGGRSAEHEISLLSARSIYQAFDKDKYNIYPLAITKAGLFNTLDKSAQILAGDYAAVPELERDYILPPEVLKFLEEEVELVFPVLHGPYGEDGKLQGFLDILNKKYIGCGLTSSAVGMDKAVMKKVFAYHQLPQSEFLILNKAEYYQGERPALFAEISQKLGLPFFIKPANMGSSIGISKVKTDVEFKEAVELAFKYDKKLVLEENIKAREIEAAVLGSGSEIKVSAAGEIIPAHEFYDYQAKYEDQGTELIIPADLKADLKRKIAELSIQAFKAISGEGISRLDFFVDENKNQVLINEINTMPGFTKISMYPLLFNEVGISYSELLDKLVELALNKEI